MVSVTAGTQNFTGVSVTVANAGLVGIDNFDVCVSGTVTLNTTSRLDRQKIDWDSASRRRSICCPRSPSTNWCSCR